MLILSTVESKLLLLLLLFGCCVVFVDYVLCCWVISEKHDITLLEKPLDQTSTRKNKQSIPCVTLKYALKYNVYHIFRQALLDSVVWCLAQANLCNCHSCLKKLLTSKVAKSDSTKIISLHFSKIKFKSLIHTVGGRGKLSG